MEYGRFAFLSKGGLGSTYDVHLRLIIKRIMDCLLVLIAVFEVGQYEMVCHTGTSLEGINHKFSAPGFVHNLTFGRVLSHFGHFQCACTETARILLPVKFLTPNLKSSWAVSYSNTNFGGTSAKIYPCFERKTAFVMQNFQNLRAGGGGGDHFLTKPPKGTSLADSTRFKPLCVQIR